LRPIFRFRLCSYNHPSLRSGDGRARTVDLVLSRLLFALYDRVIFYTQAGMEWAIDRGLVRRDRARFANNTLDTRTIWSGTAWEINRETPPVLLFIGRLIPSKRTDLLLDYLRALRSHFPDVQLRMIGDGPLADEVRAAAAAAGNVCWLGAMTDERQIAREMRHCHLVFVPGSSGLSVVHAFCYGKPYVTLLRPDIRHGPEIVYLEHGRNGLALRGAGVDVAPLVELLSDGVRYEQMCREAFRTAQGLSIEAWCRQMKDALTGVDR
jgi:glycosyltransferase involved in cell wall biosynthesis